VLSISRSCAHSVRIKQIPEAELGPPLAMLRTQKHLQCSEHRSSCSVPNTEAFAVFRTQKHLQYSEHRSTCSVPNTELLAMFRTQKHLQCSEHRSTCSFPNPEALAVFRTQKHLQCSEHRSTCYVPNTEAPAMFRHMQSDTQHTTQQKERERELVILAVLSQIWFCMHHIVWHISHCKIIINTIDNQYWSNIVRLSTLVSVYVSTTLGHLQVINKTAGIGTSHWAACSMHAYR
jgi:hypothetical protein